MGLREQRLAEVAQIAVRLEAEFGVPPEVLIAQWAIESRWGAKPAGHANYFGIKRAARHISYTTVTTHEVVNGKPEICHCEFADYDSLEESCRDYAWMLANAPAYAAAWQRYRQDRDGAAFVASVARTYATDPNYANLALTIARQANVAAAIVAAKEPTANV
jgi:flagellum-specific peptidoglycan hydrolase FlgJ